jgi:FtsK/SpoIIIE family
LHVRDTEAWVEISPANRYLTEDNLHRQAKQTKVARERAFLKGSGRDVGAEIKQVYIDLFSHTQHALITGKTGSGKSVLLWRFMLDALSQGIPVVGMDIPAADGESSFKTAIALLGDAGAYFDLSRASNNLMEPPDLRRFDSEERASRMKSWRSFIRNALGVIVMGRLDAPHLAQRVDAILLR